MRTHCGLVTATNRIPVHGKYRPETGNAKHHTGINKRECQLAEKGTKSSTQWSFACFVCIQREIREEAARAREDAQSSEFQDP